MVDVTLYATTQAVCLMGMTVVAHLSLAALSMMLSARSVMPMESVMSGVTLQNVIGMEWIVKKNLPN